MQSSKHNVGRREKRRRRKLKVLRDTPRDVSRRQFAAQGGVLLAAGAGLSWRNLGAPSVARAGDVPIRPPMALADDGAFQQACVRCGLCGSVCENGCIRYYSADEREHGAHTPYLDVRQRSCTLCMRCNNICPSGALSPLPDDLEAIADNVSMGRAVVDPEHCLSYLGRLCGYCHDACPIPGIAIRLASPAKPVVLDGCVGCGRCVEECPQEPTAIRLVRDEEAG